MKRIITAAALCFMASPAFAEGPSSVPVTYTIKGLTSDEMQAIEDALDVAPGRCGETNFVWAKQACIVGWNKLTIQQKIQDAISATANKGK